MGLGSDARKRDPEASTSFTVPVMAPSFFLITSLVRTVSDSIVFYSQGCCLLLLPRSHYWTVKDSKKHFLSGPLLQTPHPKGPSLPHCLFCRSQQLRADRLGPS